MKSTDLKQLRDDLEMLRVGCRDSRHAKWQAAIDYSQQMYGEGLERYHNNVEKIGFKYGAALDVGCGAGHWCLALAEHNDQVVGLDANEEYVAVAGFAAANSEIGRRLHIFKGVAENLPYPDSYFDYLVCHGVLMFTEHELALSEFRRVLKPGGKMYLGYSGLGWYLRYLIEDGIVNGDEARLRKGATVLASSFKFAAGFRVSGELWLSLPPEILNQLVQSNGFEITGHPGIQDIKMDGFLGLEAPSDLLALASAESAAEEEVKLCHKLEPTELASHLKQLIDIWRPRLALGLIGEIGEPKLDPESCYVLRSLALLKMGETATAERVLSGLKGNSLQLNYAKAICAQAQNQYMRALTHYEKARTQENAETVDYLRGECCRELREIRRAEDFFKQIIEQDSTSVRGWFGMICCAKSRDQIRERTAEYLETIKLTLKNPADAEKLLDQLKAGRTTEVSVASTPHTQSRENYLHPRRRTRRIDAEDPYMKLVPEDAPSKESGLRVLLLADFNIAGQMTRIMRALNRYTNHAARCVILQDDYLSYDKDVVIVDSDGKHDIAARDEAAALVRQADFYHIGRQPFALPGIDWDRILNKNNTVFQYFGSYLRDHAAEIRKLHAARGFHAITAMEWTMYDALPGGFYHIQPYMIDPENLPQVDWSESGPLRICHAPSNANYRRLKGSDQIIEVMRQLEKDRSDVEIDIIEGVSNEECLQRKSKCHLHAVSLRYGFGLNTIESAAMGLVPLVQLPNFVRLAYPDTPAVHVNNDTLRDTLEQLLDNREQLAVIGNACRQWALREFAAENLIRKYWHLYDFIHNGLSVDYPELWNSSRVEAMQSTLEVK